MSAAEDRHHREPPHRESVYREPPHGGRLHDRPITGLFGDIARETTHLVRSEFELARAEISNKVGEAAGGAISLAAGGLVAFAGFLFLLLAATLGLTEVVAGWLAALIVGGVVLLIGLIMVGAGRSRLRARNLQPNRTMESLREDRRWARSQLSR